MSADFKTFVRCSIVLIIILIIAYLVIGVVDSLTVIADHYTMHSS